MAWQELNSSRDPPRFDTYKFFVRFVTVSALYTMAIARQQIRPETLRSLVDQCFLYQQIGPEKLLSLVDQCFLYVILNLEEFPPNYLALLPRQIRKELLLSLPMVDICNLEETAVVEGIEMNDVWQSVRENRVADHVHLHPLSKVLSVGGREFCFRALIFLFVHCGSESGIEAIDFISLLYSVKLHMRCSAGKTVFSRINRRNESQVIPNRYITESDVIAKMHVGRVEIELLEIAASHFRCWPPLWIDIDVDRMNGTLKFWSCVAMSAWRERIDDLLSKIPSELNANFFNVGNDRYIGYILKVIHSHPRGPALKSVIISGAELDLDSDPKPGSLEEGFAFLPDIPLLPYHCSYCSFSADTATALHEHIENIHTPYQCGFCKHRFPKLSRLQEHVGECGASKSYSLELMDVSAMFLFSCFLFSFCGIHYYATIHVAE